MDEFSTYYDLFNLCPEASHQDLKAAYKRLVKQWHPDRFASDPVNLKIAEEKIKTINIAYEALKAHQEGSCFSYSAAGSSSPTTSVKTRRTSPQDYFNDAKRLAKLGQYREAAEELSHAVKLEPKYAVAYHLRGILFTVLGFERRGGSDLRRAAVLGVVNLDYDGDVIDLVQSCDDFKYFRHLLKKDVNSDQKTNTRQHQNPGSSHSPRSGTNNKKPSSTQSNQEDDDEKIKDIRQERQRQKQIKTEKIKPEKSRQEQSKQNSEAPNPSVEEVISRNTSHPKPPQDIPKSNFVEEKFSKSQAQTPKISIKIQPESDFSRHSDIIITMAINANGKTLATGDGSGNVDLWNYKNKRNFHTLKGHEGAVTQVAFSADSQMLISGGADGTMRLWNLSDGSFIRSFLAHEGRVTVFDLCHVRKIVITAGDDGVVRVWDLRESKLLREILHHESPIPYLALNATGEIAVCGVEDGSIRFCHTLRGGIVNWFTAHTQAVQTLTFSQDGKTFASGSSNGKVSLWSFPSGDRRQACESLQHGITALTFCHQDRLLCGADNQGHLMVWDVASGALLDTVAAHSPEKVNVIAVADDVLLSAGADGCIRQWRFQIP